MGSIYPPPLPSQTSELHVDGKFSQSNSTMFRVSSLLHRQQSYVVDVGAPRKLEDWLNKLHTVIRNFLDQAKKGRLLPVKSATERKVSKFSQI